MMDVNLGDMENTSREQEEYRLLAMWLLCLQEDKIKQHSQWEIKRDIHI
jgi:hypothetical protein